MKKKIIIATLYNGMNSGAYLQTLSLQTFLQKNGCDVFILKGNARKPFSNTFITFLKFLKNKKILNGLYLIKQFWCLKKSWKKYNLISFSKYVKNYESFDCVIFGSDEIWNVSRKEIRDYPYLWGSGIPAKFKVSYAPTIGNSTKNQINEITSFSDEIDNFYKISVRDDYSKQVLNNITKKEINVVLDPTFLIQQPILQLNDKEKCHKYVFIYAYSLYSNKDFESKIKAFSKEKNCDIVSMGAYCPWSDFAVSNSPELFLKHIQNANYVMTDTFHGSVFSVIYQRRFVVFPQENNFKVACLLNQLSLTDRMVSDKITLNDIASTAIDYDNIQNLLLPLIKKSQNYLLDILKKI